MNNFFQNVQIMVFEILTSDFYLEEKRKLQTTVYMNPSKS